MMRKTMKINSIFESHTMNKFVRIAALLLMLFPISLLQAQEVQEIQSRVTDVNGTPIAGAMIKASLANASFSAVSDSTGMFLISFSGDSLKNKGTLEISAVGYYAYNKPLSNKYPERITLMPEKTLKYTGTFTLENNIETRESKSVSTSAVSKKDFKKELSLDLAIQDEVPGLMVVGKSGMPNEGAYVNLRGVHSFIAANSPLYVLNGIPYVGNENVSSIINAYSRNVLSSINVNDIKSVTVLKGSEASQYGSLGSNGVILIETEQATSDNLDTRISFSGQYGLRKPNNLIPTLGVDDYKNYLQDVGMTRYSNYSSLLSDYPFLSNEENYYSYLFNNNTNWQSLIQSESFVTDNVFRVEGGDEIAKYNISFGYTSEGGVIENTKSDRYHTQINTNIMASRKFTLFANVGLAYLKSQLQEQGASNETNPILAASLAMPMLSPYMKESNGNVLNRYSTYNGWNTNDNPTYDYDNVSNPLAIVNTLDATDKIYDANVRFGLNFYANRYLTLTGLLNIYYNYTEESNFIPGVTDQAIMPQYYGVGYNTVRRGVIENKSYFYGLNGTYNRTFNGVHAFKGAAGLRYFGRSVETDLAWGYNTANDYYQSLGNTTEDLTIEGDNLEWRWVNSYAHADYTYNKLLKVNFNMAVDGSSVTGVDAPTFNIYPAVGITLLAGNTQVLPDAISVFNLSAEISRSGNARFSPNYAKNYYQNSNLFNLGTIVRENVPNTYLETEKNDQIEFGIDLSLFNYFLDVQANYYTARSYDLLIARNISSVYGSSEFYDNTGEIATTGMEVSVRLNPIRTKNVSWSVGGTIARAQSEIVSLGNSDELFISFEDYNDDDALIIMRKGDDPYQFYGYQTEGVYSTTSEANASGLTNIYGDAYQAGDVKFVNNNAEDMSINAKDKVALGSATPDFFGNLYTTIRVKNFTLMADVGYSVGNMAYNAVRRELESMNTFYNQSQSVQNRWQVEGQEAALPRAAYGDPAGNNVFSDRWIEDASYIKLRSITLQYDFGNLFNICHGGSVYIAGENLFTQTDYLGSSPEFSYSYNTYMQGFDYGKVSRPKTVLVGFQLNF